MTARRSLLRTGAFPALLVGSIVSTAAGGWLVADRLGTMSRTLADGTATGVEVYAGQAWAVVGAVLIGSGLIGIALTLTIAAVSGIVAQAGSETAPESDSPAEEPADDGAYDADDERHEVEDEPAGASARDRADEQEPANGQSAFDDDQNGSSGSTAIATKMSVR